MRFKQKTQWRAAVIFLLFLCSLLLASGDSLSFIVVDSVSGNDSNCQSVTLTLLINQNSTTPDTDILPCKTIDTAIQVLADAATSTGVNSSSSWLHMQPGTYRVSNVQVPQQLLSLTMSIYLPPLPAATNYSFPAFLSAANTSRVTWDCMNSANCILSSYTSLTIEGVSIRNVSLHAVHHIGTVSQSTDLALSQVDCRDSGGLLYKLNGTVSLSQVELVNATNYPKAAGFQPSLALVHFINSNVDIVESKFRDSQINASFPYPAAVMSVISQTSFVSFRMFRSEYRNNIFQSYYASPKVTTSNCRIGPGIMFNVSFITIQVDSCDIADNFGYGEEVKLCGAGLAIYPFQDPDLSHVVNVQISSSRFWNNSILTKWTTDGLGIFIASSEAASAPIISIRNCTFTNHTITIDENLSATIITIQKAFKTTITDSYFLNNDVGGVTVFDGGLAAGSLLFDGNSFDTNLNPNLYVAVLIDFTIRNSVFRNGVSSLAASAVTLLRSEYAKVTSTATIDNCIFASNGGGTGGGLSMQETNAVISNTMFTDNYSHLGGGVRVFAATVKLKKCTFINNYVNNEFFNLPTTFPASGGALFAQKSSITVEDSTFINSTFQSSDGIDSDACGSVSQGAILLASPRGGAIGLQQSDLTLTDCTIEGSSACIGGDIYANGQSVYLIDTTFSNSRAVLGGSIAMKDADAFFSFGASFFNVSADSNGGGLILSTMNQIRVSYSTFDQVQSITGDGGVFYLSLMSPQTSTLLEGLEFRNCSSPLGGGALAYVSSIDGGAVLSVDLENEDDWNTIIPPPQQKYVQWGPIQATNAILITSNLDFVSLYPGQQFSESVLADPFNVSILALDGYNQTVRGDRGIVIHCSLLDADGQATRKASLGGTALQQMTNAREAAVFDDLVISGEPGAYQLSFSVVGALYIPHIIIPALLRSDCPSSLFFKHGICTSCLNPLFVYDSNANDCVACDIGRVATSDGKCAICDLGYTNYGSPTCAQCSSNTYQPAPLVPCTSCVGSEEINGLACNNGLAEVLPGYFAFSVFLNGSSIPSIRTVQCPVGYCETGAQLQSNWSDPRIQFFNGSASTVVPYFSSAITRFDQCAYPRLASEDNYLCGQCTPPLVVWGDKCSRCDSTDAGRMILFLFLSFALVMFLVRSSLASASAGHSTVVLYYIQIALMEIGPTSNLIGWMKISLLSPSSFSDCVTQLDVYEQSTFQLLMPLFLLGELLIVMCLHYAWFRSRSQSDHSQRQVGSQRLSLSQATMALRSRFLSVIDAFSVDLYISASLSILLFTYTQVMMESFRMLACVDVAGVQVVFSQPTMRCDSAEYKRHMVLVGVVITYVGILPFSIVLFLWRNRTLVQMSHELMRQQGPLDEITMATEISSSSPRKEAISVSDQDRKLASRFLRRYSAVFGMYSAEAWFFKSVLLSRRIVLAAISVSLVRRPNMQFFAFSFAHVLSSLLQGYFRPFERDFFNWMEIASHVLLILLSQSLTAILPPYSNNTQVYLFVMIVIPVCLYIVLALGEQYMSVRRLRDFERDLFASGSIEANAGLSESPTNKPDTLQQSQSVELSTMNGKIPCKTDESIVDVNHMHHSVAQQQQDQAGNYAQNSESQQVLSDDIRRSESILPEDSAAL